MRRVAVGALWVALACALFGCAGGERAGSERPVASGVEGALPEVPAPRRVLRPAVPVVYAVPGVRLVVPIESADGKAPPARVEVLTANGERLAGRVVWLGVSLDASPGAGGSMARWLPPAGAWSSGAPRDVGAGSGLGRHVLLADVPASASVGPIWVDRNRFDVEWLGPMERVDASALVSPFTDAIRRSRELGELTLEERRSPVRRWRYLLAIGRLGTSPVTPPEAGAARASASVGGVFADEAAESLARQTEALWRRGLTDLHTMDEGLALAVRTRLVAVWRAAGEDRGASSTLAPAWPTDQADLDALLDDLVSRDLEPEERRMRVAQWLNTQPVGAGWVIADAVGLEAGTGRPVARVGAANLSGSEEVVSALTPGSGAGPAMATVGAWSSATLQMALPAEGAWGDGLARAGMQVGRWRGTRAVRPAPEPATPPGWGLTSFSLDWTLEAWRSGDATGLVPDRAWATAALVYRDSDDPFGAAKDDGWWLHVECQRPPGAAGEDAVRVWLGGMGRGSAAVEVTMDGRVRRPEGAGSRLAWDEGRVRVERGTTQWTVRLPIPPVMIGDDGVVLLGVERLAPTGRQAWPRPMLPWQREPGRAAGDLSAWSASG